MKKAAMKKIIIIFVGSIQGPYIISIFCGLW